jgi:Kef-type K+ transport system membrane component KefB
MALLVGAVGALVVLAVLMKAGLERLSIPPLVGYIALGFGARVLSEQIGVPGPAGVEVLHFLGKLGVIALLFRIGLESDLEGLLRQLRSASFIWAGNVVLSGVFGYVAGRYLLDLELFPSIAVAVAMVATSVGIPARTWRNANALDTPVGERFLDVAEMDDISGVVLMALLFALAPVLLSGRSEGSQVAWPAVLVWTTGRFALKLGLFGLACWLFSRYLEERYTNFFRRLEPKPDPMLVVVGTGIFVAAVAAWLGFSVAIGAFLAGLVFSRDPKRVQVDASFQSLYELFSPFFFVSVGLMIAPDSLWIGAGLGGVLVVAAVLGKLIGAGLPALGCSGRYEALVIGVSMVPRAEIAMIVMQKSRSLENGISDAIYSAMVLVCAATSVAAPIVLGVMLQRGKFAGNNGSSEQEG